MSLEVDRSSNLDDSKIWSSKYLFIFFNKSCSSIIKLDIFFLFIFNFFEILSTDIDSHLLTKT